jgi:hypothetical protein
MALLHKYIELGRYGGVVRRPQTAEKFSAVNMTMLRSPGSGPALLEEGHNMVFHRAQPVSAPPVAMRRGPPPAALIQPKLAMPAVPSAFAAQKRANAVMPAPFVPAARCVPQLPGAAPMPPLQRKAALPPRPPAVLPVTRQLKSPLTIARGALPVAQLRKAPAAFSARLVQRASTSTSFTVGGMSFPYPVSHEFTLTSAQAAVQPISRGEAKRETGRGAGTGVDIGNVGSYAYVQYLEKTGDGLTGDHQPSGAAVKEAVRELLHSALLQPLTRSMARNAYQKAITLVMTDVWHKKFSRTYGGRNSKAQILQDASDLAVAATKDWQTTVAGLKHAGLDDAVIAEVWQALCDARQDFFATGNAQAGTL